MICPSNCLLSNHVYTHERVFLALVRKILFTMVNGDCRDSYLVKYRNWGIVECLAPKVQGASWRKGKGKYKSWIKGEHDIKHSSLAWCGQCALELTTGVITYTRCAQLSLSTSWADVGTSSSRGLTPLCSLRIYTIYIQLTGDGEKNGRGEHGGEREREGADKRA